MWIVLAIGIAIASALGAHKAREPVRQPPEWFTSMSAKEQKAWLRKHSLPYHVHQNIGPHDCGEEER